MKQAVDCRYFRMNPKSAPRVKGVDAFLLAGTMLGALERGRVPMHAMDYREMAAWVKKELMPLDTDVLKYLCREAPPPIRGIVENILHERSVQGTIGSWSAAAELDWRAVRLFFDKSVF
jgi:hypothetical protein